MASMSTAARTMKEVRKQGRTVDMAQRWVVVPGHPAGGFRKDLFGFIDLVVLDPTQGIIGVQACGADFKAHQRTIKDSKVTENALEWLACGGKVELWGWRKVKVKRGGKAMIWSPRIEIITADDIKGGG